MVKTSDLLTTLEGIGIIEDAEGVCKLEDVLDDTGGEVICTDEAEDVIEV